MLLQELLTRSEEKNVPPSNIATRSRAATDVTAESQAGTEDEHDNNEQQSLVTHS